MGDQEAPTVDRGFPGKNPGREDQAKRSCNRKAGKDVMPIAVFI
jgi:hypothetical protein